MNCPHCDFDKSLIIRTVADNHVVVRQRQCCSCGWRWSTTEAKSDEYARLTRMLELVRPLARELPEAGQGD